MKIESIIKRKKGTVVEMDAPKRKYHFVPESGQLTDPHVCEVDVESHAAALLRIRDGYRLAEGETPPPPADDDDDTEELAGSTVHSASYTIKGGDTVELSDLIAMAWEDSGLSVEAWNKLVDQERYAYIDATLNELQGGIHGDTTIPPEDDGNKPETQQPETTQPPADNQQPNPPAAPAPQEQVSEQKPTLADGGIDPKTVSDEMTRDQLAAVFTKVIGRNPSRQMNKTDLIAAIRSASADGDD